MSISLDIIILAAGDGTRMKSRLPKVLHKVGGRPMLTRVLETAARLTPTRVHVVFNPQVPEVRSLAAPVAVNWVPQAERLGTGHAVRQALPGVPAESRVLVLYGDTPLVPEEDLRALLQAAGDGTGLLTLQLADPKGYGRVLRDGAGQVCGVVEERDASAAQRTIGEVNSGILTAPSGQLMRWLDELRTDNQQGEYYLTDVFAAAHAEGVPVAGIPAADPALLEGINDREQLARAEARLRALRARELMLGGVTLADPARVELRGDIEAGQDVSLDIDVVLEGRVRLGEGVSIGPGCVLRDCDLAAGTRVHPHSVLEGVVTTGACDIGPFARLRPGTELASGTRVGNFVEVKNVRLGEGSKASHLSYLGDADIGRQVNIGAGTITCNYDGVNKHRTEIGDGAFIGSDTQLVAPVRVGEGATLGAGTTLTRDAPAGELTVSRAKQVSVKGWKRPEKKN